MKYDTWLIFWMVIIVISNALFISVAFVVVVKGWKEMVELYRPKQADSIPRNKYSKPNDQRRS